MDAVDAMDAMDVAAVGAMDMALRCMKIWVLMVMSLNMHTTRSGAWVFFLDEMSEKTGRNSFKLVDETSQLCAFWI